MTTADWVSGLCGVCLINPSWLATFVFGNPCDYRIFNEAHLPLAKLTPICGALHVIVIAIDRYVAILHPLEYETKLTDRVVRRMIAGVWIAATVISLSYLFYFLHLNTSDCVLYHTAFPDILVYVTSTAFMLFAYTKIIGVAIEQQNRIHHDTLQNFATASATGDALERTSVRQ